MATPTSSAAPGAAESAGESPDASADQRGSASPQASRGSTPAGPSGSASPAGEPADGENGRFESGPWVVVGGGVAAVGAGVIAVQWVNLRRRSPLP